LSAYLAGREGLEEWYQLPNRRQANKAINQPRERSILTAKNRSHEVDLEKSNEKPVQASDNDKQ
jgi:hypothetical protein